MEKRSAEEITKLIIDFAKNDERVRAVLLNGSRANPVTTIDEYQDFDVVYIVNHIQDFTSDHEWIKVFGDIIIRQLPDEMVIGERDRDGFGYLLLFEDGNRIDLTLFPFNKVINNYWPDSYTVCLLDKDQVFSSLPLPNDSSFFIVRPDEKEFLDTCNEFWWVSTYVAKGLLRNEITYAKGMMEKFVRPMFMRLIEWKIGIENNFSVVFGKEGRFIRRHLPTEFYNRILMTYADHDLQRNWKALFIMTDVFSEIAKDVAKKLQFTYNLAEDDQVQGWLEKQYNHGLNG